MAVWLATCVLGGTRVCNSWCLIGVNTVPQPVTAGGAAALHVGVGGVFDVAIGTEFVIGSAV
jgi:hypothetical protein